MSSHTSLLRRISLDPRVLLQRSAAAPMPARLSGPVRFPYGAFKFAFNTSAGAQYEIQASTDFKSWTTTEHGATKTENVEYIDSSASKFSYRFYRVLTEGMRSINMIGYATITLPPGHSMIANPFHSGSNTVAELFKGVPEATTLNKFNTRDFAFKENFFQKGRWTHPHETLLPGEGALLFNSTSDYKPLNFVGEVMADEYSLPIPAGFSMRSSLVPVAGRVHEDLGFPISEGDVIHVFDTDRQQYVLHHFNDREKWAANPPRVNAGEAFWVEKVSAKTWKRPNLRELEKTPD